MENLQADSSMNDEQDKNFYYATQWSLIRSRFRQHRLALVSLFILALLYLFAIFSDFLAPYSSTQRFSKYNFAAPTSIHIYDPEEGLLRPFVYGQKKILDKKTFAWKYEPDLTKKIYIQFFTEGEEYSLFGIFKSKIHFFGIDEKTPVFLFGSDRLGRDVFSRTIHGSQISLSIGLVGVSLSFLIGILLGGISGYYGGYIDDVIQRFIDFMISLPTIPLWMAFSAVLPRDWSSLKTYFAITIILSIISWGPLARVTRGKILALREEDYTLAAKAAGASTSRIIVKHLLPGFTSHLIVSITLSIPGMILAETALSFLGLGIQPPAVSWGTLLQDSQDLMAITNQPWLLIPALFVIGTVLLFNFVGDGLRDAADPYS